MSEQIMEVLTPVIMAVLLALASIATVAIASGRDLVVNWIKSRTDANQQEVIEKVAAEAYAYAERWGGDKLAEAIKYVSAELARRGIDVPAIKIEAAIQSAWEKYGNKK